MHDRFYNTSKAFLILLVIALTIRKCWKRWSVATTDPMRFSNFAQMECIENILAIPTSDLTLMGRISRIALMIKYDELLKEAGIKLPRKRKKTAPIKKQKPSENQIRQ